MRELKWNVYIEDDTARYCSVSVYYTMIKSSEVLKFKNGCVKRYLFANPVTFVIHINFALTCNYEVNVNVYTVTRTLL